ncbi:hypothetical protein [Burkholderia pseudomultivorans]|uniref:hypothetical protein n=1 Tax=Burkholderia pseudomultivorans TaxID=1207504 RepID=UPI0012DB1A56|nr:hypothetical protein [Burkholderia pseudomultivorans]
MRAPLNSPTLVSRGYSRSVVSRPAGDNDLLRSCARVHRSITIAAAFGLFVCVGVLWYVAVAIRAGGAL